MFFSEYIEGSSNNKAIEVYNGTGADIDLANYIFERLNGGSTTPALRAFTGTVTAGDVFVISNASADPLILAVDDVTSDLTFYNGDDFLGLYEISGSDTTLIDVIGERGVDPGTNWPVGTGATSECTLVRMSGINEGTTIWSGVGNTQWDVFPANTFTYLGFHGATADSPPLVSGVVTIPATVYAADSPLISASITDDSAVSSASLAWGLVSGSLTNTIVMDLSVGDTWITSSSIPSQTAGARVFYNISAIDDASQTRTTSESSYSVVPTATLTPGDLVITEILQNPGVSAEASGEWFELYNATTNSIDLMGITFIDTGSNSFTVDESVIVAPDDFAVLGIDGNTALNGNVALDYDYPAGFVLGNGADAIIILDGVTEIDRAAYDGGITWPDPTGASMYLTDNNADNNIGANWGISSLAFGAGDFGTPGSANYTEQEYVYSEDFNNSGSLPFGWTIQSQSVTLTSPWIPIHESGNDWAVQTSQTAFSVPQVEWLFTPIYNLTGYQDIELGYNHTYTHASSTATVKYSTNGGVAWQTLTNYTSTSSGNIVTDISSWADGVSNVRFAFVFTGQFVVGGASWRIDDFFLDGVAVAPVTSSPVPTQPPANWNSLSGTIGCSWTHPLGVNGASLEVRIDANGDGVYQGSGAEGWTPLPYVADDSPLVVSSVVAYTQAGLGQAFEFRARSGNGLWGFSGTAGVEGIADDWFVNIVEPDDIPPTSSTLLAGGSTSSSVTLLFSPTFESHFARYEIRCSTDSLVDESDMLWTDTNDSALAQIGTYQTIVTGLASGTTWYFRLWAVDLSGNRSPASNRVRKVTEGSQVSPVTDLHASVQPGVILLTWSAPTTDVYGQTPVAIEHYEVHASVDPFFTPNAGTRIGTTSGLTYTVANPGGGVRSCFKVVVVGAGPYSPFSIPVIHVPSGTFNMGQPGVAPVHAVTLTHDFWMGETEITNHQFVEVINWAFQNDYFLLNGTYANADGVNLFDYSDPRCPINFENGVFSLKPVFQGTFLGTNAANHPVQTITWFACAYYCDWLSLLHGLVPYYGGEWSASLIHNPYESTGFRLPTEAEWEYAARYSDGRYFPWGTVEPTPATANFDCWPYPAIGGTSPVRTFPSGVSMLGFYDLAGNVWEYCNDWYSLDNYSVVNPMGPESGSSKVNRGGCWVGGIPSLRSASRNNDYPLDANLCLGFRICRSAPSTN